MNILRIFRSAGRTLLCPALFLAGSVGPLAAQQITLAARDASPVTVESVEISSEVTGRMAVTTFDLVFRNPNNRVLEGTFDFPLLEGQNVVGFALDIDGRLRAAVPVEKDRGRIVFEEIRRRGVDPGLLEQTVGNNYRARIYPIPARGTRRVLISYQEDLARGNAGPRYRLALAFPETVKDFHLEVTVQAAEPGGIRARTTLPLELPAWQEARRLDVRRPNFKARGIFELELPQSPNPKTLTERREANEYFYSEVPVPSLAPVARPAPAVVGLLWDASGSGRERDHEKELALLDAWFARVPEVEVRLIVCRDYAEAPRSFQITGGGWGKLRRELEKTVYDGATSFDGVTDDPAVGEWLLFSDGVVNYGRVGSALTLRAPVHAIMAGAQADPALLRGLARRHRGEYVNLLDTEATDAAAQLRQQSVRVLEVDYDPEQISQVFPEVDAPVGDGSLVVTGRLKVPAASLRLRLGHDATDAREIVLALRTGENPSRLAARAWAATKIASMEPDRAANREDIRRTSQEFGIVTGDTSLIVLETLQDYVRYDIVPPEELRAEWTASRRSAADGRQKNRGSQLDRIARLFAEKVQWWEAKKAAPTKSAFVAPASNPVSAAVPPAANNEPAAVPPVRPASRGGVRTLEEEVIVLSPFVVTAPSNGGYMATNTMSGTRLRTELADLATGRPAVAGRAATAEVSAPAEAGGIVLQRWEGETAGYLDRLRRARIEKRYAIYLEERSDYLRQPGFFLDVADFFFAAKEPATALRILSNLAELQLDDPALLRVLAHRLVQADRPDLARPVFERVLVLRPEEPQSRRDLALVCAALGQSQRAVDLLWEVVSGSWDARFPEIELIALGELNAIIATSSARLDLNAIDSRFLRNLPVGLRVILTWDTDACDVDLWVDDPLGERANYSRPLTAQGGRMSRDFTGGYGPEEFLLRDPVSGLYTVRFSYYGDSRQTSLGPVTVQIRLITGFGTPQQKEERRTLRLVRNKETREAGVIVIGG